MRNQLNHHLDSIKRPSEINTDSLDRFAVELGRLFDQFKISGMTDEFRNICQSHPLANIFLLDPYSKRAFEKPRGYAGDAVMLDYIYRPSEMIELCAVGNQVHKATTTLPNAKSILWRRDYIAQKMIECLEKKPICKVLSVASGHMRELDILRANHISAGIRIFALDQDKDSIEESQKSYPDFDITGVEGSISIILQNRLLESQFDFIYSAGLADYLDDRTFSKLLKRLYGLLAAGGTLTIGNFTDDSHGRGFMEGFMAWSLIYRNENDMQRVAADLFPGKVFHIFRDDPGNVVYLELTKN